MNLEMLRKRCIQIASPLMSAAPSVLHLRKKFYTQVERLSRFILEPPRGPQRDAVRISACGHVAGADPRLSGIPRSLH